MLDLLNTMKLGFFHLKVIFDNTTTEDMPSGYPKLEVKGSKQTFIFRFRKFDKSALYDPIVSVGNEDGGDDGGDDSGTDTETDVATSGISAKVLGKSGKITLAKTTGISLFHLHHKSRYVLIKLRNSKKKSSIVQIIILR
jgi:hypothetical protein